MAMSVLGQNIANANNTTYKRQQVIMSGSYLSVGNNGTTPQGFLGSGVQISSIRRLQDSFVDSQLLGSNQDLGKSQTSKNALDQVVSLVGEPSDTGISSALDKFWNAWQDLSGSPDSSASRNALVSAAQTVTSSMNNLYTKINALRTAQDQTVRSDVDTVNGLASQLASVNQQIQQAVGAGATPNDLLDKRDDLLSQLSSLTNVQIHGDGGANDVISISGHVLVQGARAEKLTTGTDASGHATVLWAEDSSAANITGGEIGGALDISNNVLPGYLTQLDTVANGLMSGVNALHETGYGLDGSTGTAFFTGTGAGNITVNAAITANPSLIAAASAKSATGDGSLALSIAKLKSSALVGTSTVGEAYSTFVSKNATDDSNFADRVTVQTKIQQQLTTQQQSVSGVSVDEEMADMVKYQQSYNASARVLSTMNSMINTLMGQMGVTTS
jgi:flagellar hook-associated protein 1 FlgK